MSPGGGNVSGSVEEKTGILPNFTGKKLLKGTIAQARFLCYHMRIQADCIYSTNNRASLSIKEEKEFRKTRGAAVWRPVVMQCRLIGDCESVSADALHLESEKYGKCNPEEH